MPNLSVYKTTLLMFSDITEDEKSLLITLLSPIEIKHQEIITNIKNKNIDDLMAITYSQTELNQINEMLASFKTR